MTPPPDSYLIKTCFDGESPTIRKNHLTTSFKQQCGRDAFGKVFAPGNKSPKEAAKIPGPGHYSYTNMSIGVDALKYTLKPRHKHARGKLPIYNLSLFI